MIEKIPELSESQKKSLEKITILVTVRERCKHLRRALDYYSHFPLKIIVMDSSTTPCKIREFEKGVQRIHFPETFFADALISSFKHVKTPYCIIASDDDFFIPSVLADAVIYLEENSAYQCVHGHVGRFVNGKKLELSSAYAHIANGSITDDSPVQRILSYLRNYVTNFHAVHRTNRLVQTFIETIDLKNYSTQEVVTGLILASHGKIKILPELFSVREWIVTAQSSLNVKGNSLKRAKLSDVVREPEQYSILYEEFRNSVFSTISKFEKNGGLAKIYTEKAIEAYREFYKNYEHSIQSKNSEGVSFEKVMASSASEINWKFIQKFISKHNLSPVVPPVLVDDSGKTVRHWYNLPVLFYSRFFLGNFLKSVLILSKRLWNISKNFASKA